MGSVGRKSLMWGVWDYVHTWAGKAHETHDQTVFIYEYGAQNAVELL